jgi:hypothetical protein
MYFNCKLEVIIGGKLLETVNEVEVTNDVDHIGATCEISVPLVCRIQNEGQYLIDQPRNLFKTAKVGTKGSAGNLGDAVQIYAWYEEYNSLGKQLIFDGFLYDFMEGNPIKMRCVDYIAKLQQGEVNLTFPGKTKFKKVIDGILAGTDITVMSPYVDMDVENMSFPNMSRAACLQLIKQQLPFLLITLFGSKLYINTAKASLKDIYLQSDINVIGANLQKPDAAFGRFKVQMTFKKPDGTKEVYEVEDSDPQGELREVKCMDVPIYKGQTKDAALLRKMGKQAMENLQMGHYKGKFVTLLYPEIDLFDVIHFTDVRYKERSAKYLVRAIKTTLGKDGFHRESTVAYLDTL